MSKSDLSKSKQNLLSKRAIKNLNQRKKASIEISIFTIESNIVM